MVETEGTYTVEQNYTNLDIHVGQSYSFLVTMDQNASSDYYIVASARFVNGSVWDRVTGVGILHYSNSKGKASGPLPEGPNDVYDKTWSMNQARSIRWMRNIFLLFLVYIYPLQYYLSLLLVGLITSLHK
jgi:Multicopper oxidase